MNIDFIAVLTDDYTIQVYDASPVGDPLPANIYNMTLDIISSKIPNGQIYPSLDIIAYLLNQRIQQEIYTIDSSILGLGESQLIPDGVYHFTYNINNIMIREHKFLVYRNVEKEVIELNINAKYNVDIDSECSLQGDDIKYDIEKVALANNLFEQLKLQTQEPDEVKVNDTLDKLTRLLEIINTN